MAAPELERLWQDPRHWKPPGIYRCAADPRLIVPKRRRWAGWTLNFAHRTAWLVLLGSILVAVGPLLIVLTAGPVSAATVVATIVASVVVLSLGSAWESERSRRRVPRRADVFFYGLFMDQDLLRSKGFAPEGAELASVPGFALRIGQRATLVPDRTGRAHGIVMSLTVAELERLYAEPSVQAYKPQAVLAHLASGGVLAALAYNLPEPPEPSDRNPEYASKLRAVAQKVGLPVEYIASLR